VAAVMIVGVQPAGELFAAFGVAAVEPRIGPFIGQGAVKTLHFAVGLWPVGAGSSVFDVAERVGEGVKWITSSRRRLCGQESRAADGRWGARAAGR
jgi:hypothetical protein